MADTRVQLEVEDWVRRDWMSKHFAARFSRERVRLSSGGYFDADAVSEDFKIVAAISTSGARTSGGKNAVGKMLKIRSDMYFLLLADTQRRMMILTEADMFAQCQKEAAGGRIPQTIEFFHVEIPPELKARLVASRGIASGEIIVTGKLSA